jgi:hypothetical protein
MGNSQWMFDEIFLKAGVGADQPDVFNFPMRGNPYLSDAAVKTLEDACDESECAARLDGVFKHLVGLVYKEFGQVHRIKSFPIPKDWTRGLIMDYHDREPCALLWYAVDAKNTLYFYDELKIDRTVFEIGEAIMRRERDEYGQPVPNRFIDNISATPDRITGKSPMREFVLVGNQLQWNLYFRSVLKKRDMGVRAVREYLRIKNDKPGVYFFEDKVPLTISAMLHYTQDMYEGEKSEHNHFADDVRYACVIKPIYKYLSEMAAAAEDVADEEESGITGYRGH